MIKATAVLVALLITGSCHHDGGNATDTWPQVARVLAAASLQPAFDRIKEQLRTKQHVYVTFIYGGTQTLTRSLLDGVQADVFASADASHMTTVENARLLGGAPRVFAHNHLEIAVAHGNPKKIHGLADLARPGLVVVLADPSVPAGKYAQQALAKANVTLKPASLELQVTGALTKVALGEADAGIVYVSDVTTSGKVDGVAIPDNQNVVADYEIATLAKHQAIADAFVSFVFSPAGQSILKEAGFDPA